jgi:cytochrome c oxidase subunit I+III
VTSREPLWDHPQLAREVADGAHWLPGSATGRREAIVTSPVRAHPLYLQVLPGDSWWPFAAAVGTAGFFLLLTIKLTLVAWACGIVAVASVLAWMWQSDRPPAQRSAKVADDVVLPVGVTGPASHSWWGTVIMLVVDGTIFASFLFAHIHISMRLEVCPPPGSRLPEPLWPMLSCGLLLAGSLLIEWTRRTCALVPAGPGQHRGQGWQRLAIILALACMLGAFGIDLRSQVMAGLDPTAHAWGATVAAMLAYQGMHAVLLLILAIYLLARSWTGRLTPSGRATLDNCALVWHYATLQGLCIAAAVQWLPKLMG